MRLHLAHTRNRFVGKYDPPVRGRRGQQDPQSAARAAAAAERWRKRRESGPLPEDIKAAEDVLKQAQTRTLPEALLADARHTLTLAGRQ